MDIGISNPVLISSIEIEHEWAAASFSWSDASLSHKFDTSGEGKVLRYDLSTLNFQEPTAVVVPSTATYTIESSNHDVALMNPNTFGDILFVNTGTVDITGTLQTGSTPYPSDTYTVEVWANNANYTESGNTCTMSEIGMLNADRKTVTAISGILLEFGNPNDATLIVEDPSGVTNKKVAYTINKENGWRDKYPYDDSQAPTRGTFYKFTALTNGKLTFKGTKVLGTNDVVFVKVNNLSSPLYTSNVSTPSEITSTEITLTAGESYYLYGKTGETWEVFLLSEFTYVSDFQLVDANNNEVFYGATSVGATSATDVATIIGTTTPQASVVGYSGNIISASVDISDSKLQVSSIEGTGGAIRIMVTDGVESVNKRYFTLTVPYGAHTWDFRPETNNRLTKQGIVTYLKNNTNNDNSSLALSGLTRTYKVGSKNSQGQWISLVDPIIAVNGRVKGDNGFYFNETSGLIFETRSSGLGVKETACSYWTVTDDGETFYYSSLEDIPESMQTSAVNQSASVNGKKYDFDNEAQYRLTYKVTTEADYLMMRGESTIIFPGVHAGQYIKIYTYRHDTNDGETYKLKNLSDLDNNPYNQNHTITYHGILSGDGTSANAIRNCYGAATFKVTATPGTDISSMPAITLSDDGWAKVYKIEVCEDYSTHMKMSLNRGPYPEFIDVVPDCEYASIVVKDKNPVTQQYSGVCTQILVQNAGTCEFDVSVVDGTVNYTSAVTVDRTYNLLNVTYNGGRGVLKITQSEKSGEEPNRYTIDKKDFYIAVNELHSKFYPYTWDFTNYNMFQGSSSTTSNLTTPTGASYDGYGKWTKTSGTYGVNFKKDVALEDVTTPKVIFAHGSELCAGATPISETAGLGVSGAYTTTSIERSTGGVTYNYSYKMYSNTDGSIAINGNTLSGAGEITIPNVGDGMYIFVKANNEPSVTGASAAEDPFSTKDDVYLYQNTSGSTQDVVLSFASSTNVDIVAVTDIVKRLDKFGYATESRDRAIDHTYAGKLTSNDVDAYIITTSDDYGTTYEYKGYPMVKKTHVASDIVPPNTGIVLCKEGHNGSPFTSPLFVPAVNKVPANNEASGEFWMSNWMIPNVKNKLHESEVTSRNEATSEEPSINTLPYYDNGVISTPAWIMNASSSTIFGSIHSDPVRYVDLAGYKELHIYQSAGDPVRCFFVDKNRVSGSDYAVITLSSAPVHYVNSGEYYSLDLNSIYETYGQVKLIGIKASAHNTEAIVSDVKAIPYANPDATPCTKFVMTTSYYTYSEISNSFSEEKTATVESFYRVILDKNGATAAENNTLGANKALLLIPSNKLPVALWNKTSGSGSGARKGVIYIDLDEFEEQEATSVDNEAIIDHSIGNDVYYSISGTCISGKPTKKGFYIHNGKKVSVK